MDDLEITHSVKTIADFPGGLRTAAAIGNDELIIKTQPKQMLELARVIERGLAPPPAPAERLVFVPRKDAIETFDRWIWTFFLTLAVFANAHGPAAYLAGLARTWVASW
jgi:hypothetical protein